jgi:hypothetical protein
MADINPFLNIETKADSPAKIAAATGKPHNQFVWAVELNATRDKINILRNLIRANAGNIDLIIATGVEIDLGELVDTTLVEAVNGLAEGYNLGVDGTAFIKYISDGYKYVYVFTGLPGQYGAGVDMLTLTDADVNLLYDGEEQAQQPQTLKTFICRYKGVGELTADVLNFVPTITFPIPGVAQFDHAVFVIGKYFVSAFYHSAATIDNYRVVVDYSSGFFRVKLFNGSTLVDTTASPSSFISVKIELLQ